MRSGTIKCMLLIAPTAVVLVLLEIGFRFYYTEHDRAIREGFRMLYSPVYASIAAPDQYGRHKTAEFNVELKSNSHGFRDKEWDRRLDVAFLGDSYVWGTGVEERERFSNLFADATRLEVGNFGLCTAGTVNELAIYLDFVRVYEPRYVILVFFPNDVQNNAWMIDGKWIDRLKDPNTPIRIIESRRTLPVTWPDENKLALPRTGFSALWHFSKSQFDLIGARVMPKMKKTVSLPGVDGKPIDIETDLTTANSNWAAALKTYTKNISDAWDLTKTSLQVLNDQVRKDGGNLILVYLPYQERIHLDHWNIRKTVFRLVVPDSELDFDRPRRIVEAFARQRRIVFHDLTPALLSASKIHPGQALYYEIDGHLTALGNWVVAESLVALAGENLTQ